ncbi:hypothetical protein OESDEN_23373 [Oesophagostomum dentatum]|uniref:Uncharacterized protein n=1 Tax=Oesophagostomum dentatum TaxID=61180 RepID=A0A0B1S0K2_OESDE|nr:hypothetical protein OESDEN_23373 [Oesophagostomum dentatum]
MNSEASEIRLRFRNVSSENLADRGWAKPEEFFSRCNSLRAVSDSSTLTAETDDLFKEPFDLTISQKFWRLLEKRSYLIELLFSRLSFYLTSEVVFAFRPYFVFSIRVHFFMFEKIFLSCDSKFVQLAESVRISKMTLKSATQKSSRAMSRNAHHFRFFLLQ